MGNDLIKSNKIRTRPDVHYKNMKIKVHRFPRLCKVFSLYPGIVHVTNIEGTIV